MRTASPHAGSPPGTARRRLVFDAPKASEWAAWWASPARARLYVALVTFAAAAVTVGDLRPPVGAGALAVVAVLALAGVGTVEMGRLAEGGRVDQQRIHKGISAWPFAAALLVAPGLAGVVAAVVYAHARVRGIRITLWKWIGSWGIVTLAAAAASAGLRAVAGGTLPAHGSWRVGAGVAVALVVFLVAEAGLLAVISRLNSEEDEVYLRAQLAAPGFYLVESAVLASGAVAALVYRFSPVFLLFAGPAYLLMQRGLLHQPLRQEASHDPKTGVLHSEAWREAAELALTRARRERRGAAVLLVDIDHFKVVNDTHGHLTGDTVLTAAVDAVLGTLRNTDVAGRFGGDEFCALLVCDSAGEATAVAERIRSRIRAVTLAGAPPVTASIGVAVSDSRCHLDLRGLVAEADEALYEAKSCGRDRVATRLGSPT